MTARTPAQRKADERKRYRDKGFVRLPESVIWIPEAQAAKAIAYLEKITKKAAKSA